MIDRTASALAFINSLTLPSGVSLGAAGVADQWIERDILRPILATDADGLPLHRLCWVELSRGHAKTSTVSAIAIAEAVSQFGTEIYCIAADFDQAALVTESIEGQLFRNPRLRAVMKARKDGFHVPKNHSRIRVVASDVASFFGIGGSARRLKIICDEVTQWRDRRMLDAALSSLPKVADSQLIVITNAGVIGSWQEQARQDFAETGYLFAADGVIASWIKQEDIDRLRLPELVRRRFYGNQWTVESGDFITAPMLARCVDPRWEPQKRGDGEHAYYVGVDLGLTHDRTVRAIVHWDAETQSVVLDDMRVWQGTGARPVEISEVEADLERVNELYHRPQVFVDPWQLKSSVQRLSRLMNISEFAFSGPSVMRLSEALYSLISSGGLRLYPDAELERELLQLQVKQTSIGWRVDHQRGGFSDRAIALGVAALHAVERGGYLTRSFQELQDLFHAVPVGPPNPFPLGGPQEQDARDDERGGDGWVESISTKVF